MKTLILHIGMDKTGTTAIQHRLHSNRDVLRENSCCYPKVGAGASSNNIVSLFKPEKRLPRTIKTKLKEKDQEFSVYVEKVEKKLSQALKSSAKTFVLSSEFLFYLSLDEIKHLRSFFTQFFDEIVVLAYVREPIDYYKSSFQQKLKGSHVLKRPDVSLGIENNLLAWRSVFPNLCVYDYTEISSTQGGVVGHFLSHLGVANLPKSPKAKSNRTLSPAVSKIVWLVRQQCYAKQNGVFDKAMKRFITNLTELESKLDIYLRPSLSKAAKQAVVASNGDFYRTLSVEFGITYPRQSHWQNVKAEQDFEWLFDDIIEFRQEDYRAFDKLISEVTFQALSNR